AYFCKPCQRAAIHPPQVITDFKQYSSEGIELSAQHLADFLPCNTCKRVCTWDKLLVRTLVEVVTKFTGKTLRCINARPYCGTALGLLASYVERLLCASVSMFQRGRPR